MIILDNTGTVVGIGTGKDKLGGGLTWAEETPELLAKLRLSSYEDIPYDKNRAITLLTGNNGADVKQAVQMVLSYLQELSEKGLQLPDELTFQGILQSLELRYSDDLVSQALYGLKLRTLWDRVVYHCGTLKDAEQMWPYLIEFINN